jgi:hypothetical protein
MQLIIRRAAMIAACGVVFSAVTTSTALAAGPPTVTTLQATAVTSTSAILNGTVTANGLQTAWQFQWGPSISTLQYSPTIAGEVGATGTSVPVSVQLNGLTPGTTYAFRLLGFNAANLFEYSYYGRFTQGPLLSFTTKRAPGRLTLASTKLRVRRGFVSFRLLCASRLACKGKAGITGRGKLPRHSGTRKFACIHKKSFSIAAGKSRKIKASVTTKCLTALAFARHHRIKARLNATTSTGQPKLHRTVRLFT